MDKYEFNIKVEQIKKLINKGDYDIAMKIADTIDWKRVRSANLLSMVAEIYEKNNEYQEAKEILLLAFERAPIGKRLLFKLAELALKEGNIKEAEDYYREFCDLAPEDPRQYLLCYLILKGKNGEEEQLIHLLERYTNTELDEKWLYELAELYCKAGREDMCTRTCDKIMMMFGLGKYVDKAMELKIQYAPLTGYQIDLIENRDKYEEKLRAVERKFGGASNNILDNVDNDYDGIGKDSVSVAETNTGMEEDEGMPYRMNDEDLAASFRQAEVEKRLAKVVSEISVEEYREPESEMEHTKIIRNIKDVIPAYVPPSEGTEMPESLIVVEEAAGNSMMELECQCTAADTPEEELENETEALLPGMESAVSAEPEAEAVGEKPDSQIIAAETVLQNTTHLMIETRSTEKGLGIAIRALKNFHKTDGDKNSVIKISGGKLSGRGVLASSDKMAGKDLVIEEAGDLTKAALNELNDVMMKDRTGMRVILIDNPKQIESMCHSNPGLASMFAFIGEGESHEREVGIQSEIPVQMPKPVLEQEAASDSVQVLTPPPVREPVSASEKAPVGRTAGRLSMRDDRPVAEATAETAVTVEPGSAPVAKEAVRLIPAHSAARLESVEEEMELRAFVDYACQYASEIDCSINGKSMLALYERIEIMEEDGVALTKTNAEELIEEAADRAEKFSIKKMFTGLFSPKYDKEGFLILREEHF